MTLALPVHSARPNRLAEIVAASGARPGPGSTLVVLADLSGSMEFAYPELLPRLIEDAAEILVDTGAKVVIVPHNHDVGESISIEDPFSIPACVSQPMGCGTSFDPGFELADAMNPTLIIEISDGMGYVSAEPKTPVIWAVPADLAFLPGNLPFGDVVSIDIGPNAFLSGSKA